MRISDWSSDVCSSDLKWLETGKSEHLKLVAHRVPKPDVERALFTAGLHRLRGKPAKPFAHADGRDARHHDLIGVGRGDAGKVFGFHGTASVQYSSDSMIVMTRLVIAGFAASSLRSEEHTSELQSLMRIS